jgi:hypothetical protein
MHRLTWFVSVLLVTFAWTGATGATSAASAPAPARQGLAPFRSEAELSTFLGKVTKEQRRERLRRERDAERWRRESKRQRDRLVEERKRVERNRKKLDAERLARELARLDLEILMKGAVTESVQVSSSAAMSDTVTNTQEPGVDEGGLVKRHGDHLVILRRGRLLGRRAGVGLSHRTVGRARHHRRLTTHQRR